MTVSLSVCTCVGVWVSIRVSDLHKDFPLCLETFCQADRSVYRNQPFHTSAASVWKWRHIKDIPESLLHEDNLYFFCRSVPLWTVYLPSTWGHPHPRQKLRVWRPPVWKHKWRSLRRWECKCKFIHIPAHKHTHTESIFANRKYTAKEDSRKYHLDVPFCSLSLFSLMNSLLHSTSLGFTELHLEVCW